MKKSVAYILSYVFYFIGDGISHLMRIRFLGWLYYLYNLSMNISFGLQMWANNKNPWKEINKWK